MKKYLCILPVILAICLLTACAHEQNQPTPKGMVILQSSSSSSGEDFTHGAIEAAKKYGIDLTFKTVTGENVARQQVDMIHSAIQEGYDGVIIDPADTETIGQAVAERRKHGITVVSMNNSNIDQNCTVNIDEDQMASGIISVAQALSGSDSSLVVLNCLDDYDNTQRIADALRARTKEFPDMKWDEIDFHTGVNTEIENSIHKYITDKKEKFCIIALNGYATTVATNQLKNSPDGQKIGLISFSQDKYTISLLEQNRVNAICVNQNVNTGFTAVAQLYQGYIGGIPSNVFIPSVFVTMQNLYSSGTQELLFPIS